MPIRRRGGAGVRRVARGEATGWPWHFVRGRWCSEDFTLDATVDNLAIVASDTIFSGPSHPHASAVRGYYPQEI